MSHPLRVEEMTMGQLMKSLEASRAANDRYTNLNVRQAQRLIALQEKYDKIAGALALALIVLDGEGISYDPAWPELAKER